MANKGVNWRGGPQSYYVPEFECEIKVEKVHDTKYVAHFPTGLERVDKNQVHHSDWTHMGPWINEFATCEATV